uniref:Uncharacterized protein n=1 Tax=Zea mays TaxID=4577 RepID=C0HIK1_MAIZE|nr:unknown [Zea mays]
MRGLHRCPHQLLLVSPPPRSAPACRQSATASSRGLRSSLAVFSAPGARVAAAAREQKWGHVEGDEDGGEEGLGEALHRTRELVECAMFAAVAGLAYFLSNSLAIENYFSCFFPLPIVISSLRWGLEASRKTVVSPIKSLRFFVLFCQTYTAVP